MNTKLTWIAQVVLMGLFIAGTGLGVRSMVSSAAERLAAAPAEVAPEHAPVIADTAEVGYCSEQMKTVLRRVLSNCGLIGGGRRGCQPGELRKVAQIDDHDFNSLFRPLDKRAGVLLFDPGKHELDQGARELAEQLWSDQQGASYFFIVGRSSPDGAAAMNQALSHRRVNSVLFDLQERFKEEEPELEGKVGLLWLGEEYAQLGDEFCSWRTSRPDVACDAEKINRSVIVSWIDCRL